MSSFDYESIDFGDIPYEEEPVYATTYKYDQQTTTIDTELAEYTIEMSNVGRRLGYSMMSERKKMLIALSTELNSPFYNLSNERIRAAKILFLTIPRIEFYNADALVAAVAYKDKYTDINKKHIKEFKRPNHINDYNLVRYVRLINNAA